MTAADPWSYVNPIVTSRRAPGESITDAIARLWKGNPWEAIAKPAADRAAVGDTLEGAIRRYINGQSLGAPASSGLSPLLLVVVLVAVFLWWKNA